ncbi:hypothetical protein L7F22_066682 [Adiantum nelumboides]|nr:hypothetical protein [Adiantum nelumboides]
MNRLRWAVSAQARIHCTRSANRRKRRPSLKDVRKNNQEPLPPVAKKKAYIRCIHGLTWDDPYHWMSNARDPRVRKHLELENLYADSVLASTLALQSQLREEMACRIVGDDSSPPERWGPWLYYARVPAGKDYPVYLRRQSKHSHQSWLQKIKSTVSNIFKEIQSDFDEQKLLDMNELVKGHDLRDEKNADLMVLLWLKNANLMDGKNADLMVLLWLKNAALRGSAAENAAMGLLLLTPISPVSSSSTMEVPYPRSDTNKSNNHKVFLAMLHLMEEAIVWEEQWVDKQTEAHRHAREKDVEVPPLLYVWKEFQEAVESRFSLPCYLKKLKDGFRGLSQSGKRVLSYAYKVSQIGGQLKKSNEVKLDAFLFGLDHSIKFDNESIDHKIYDEAICLDLLQEMKTTRVN